MNIERAIATELEVSPNQVERTLELFADGATVPFIARYRKDVTGDLDETKIRLIQERHEYLSELHARKQTVLATIEAQDKLTPDLAARIERCATKTELEDLYLPYKPKRRTRATIAREKGLGPLADRILEQTPEQPPPEQLAKTFVEPSKGVESLEEALGGAADIVAERVAESADLRAEIRRITMETGQIAARPTKDWVDRKSKFESYYDFREPAKQIPSHRYLAIARGVSEDILISELEVEEASILGVLERGTLRSTDLATRAFLRDAVADAYHRLMAPSIETDVRRELKVRADTEALKVFQSNLRSLLLAAPLGEKRVLAVDPGYRTGAKLAIVDETGKFLVNTVVFITSGDEKKRRARQILTKLLSDHNIETIAIGNGTASRETEAFVRECLSRESPPLRVQTVVVNESGASIYSVSPLAREEFPSLDATVRGAISIGRRLQDPLAELVKIDPKSIGVGQYQHDVDQKRLRKSLDDVVESAVNFVGVEVNTASAPLLEHVSGIGRSLSASIVSHRDQKGSFCSRKVLLDVRGFGPKAFQQSAGFLRVQASDNPLDNSAVHPEHYSIVDRMARDLGVDVSALLRDHGLLARIDPKRYVDDIVGELTLRDILDELEKPGRDPRAAFETTSFDPNITEMSHLREGQVLNGIVTNVTHFGCFVDIGVHQDGLVHVSRMADRFVKDPNKVAKAGDHTKVRVLEVDLDRQRISLTMRRSDLDIGSTGTNASNKERARPQEATDGNPRRPKRTTNATGRRANTRPDKSKPFNTAFADLANIMKRK